MSPVDEIPTTEEIYYLIKEIDTVSEVDQIDDGWIQIHGTKKSIAVCPIYEAENKISVLEKGAELLAGNISEVIFTDPPALFVLTGGPPFQVRQEDVLGSELSEALPAIIQELLQSEFDNYRDVSRADLGKIFRILLSEATANRNAKSIEGPGSGDSFSPIWPQETQAGLADTAAKWLLRNNPDTVLDLCSDLGGFSAAIASRRQNTGSTDQYIVDHPIQQVEVRRLLNAYYLTFGSSHRISG